MQRLGMGIWQVFLRVDEKCFHWNDSNYSDWVCLKLTSSLQRHVITDLHNYNAGILTVAWYEPQPWSFYSLDLTLMCRYMTAKKLFH